jgi:hypothetical protein
MRPVCRSALAPLLLAVLAPAPAATNVAGTLFSGPTTPEEEGLDKPSPTGTCTRSADLFSVGIWFAF